MKDGMKTGITERPGGGSGIPRSGILMKGSGILLKSFGFRIADSDDRGFPLVKTTERPGGVWNPALLDFDDRGFPLSILGSTPSGTPGN